MKRMLALILSLMLVLSGAAFSEKASAETKDTLVVGSLTRLSGDFFAGLFSNNTADADVQLLLHEPGTISWKKDNNYGVNETIIDSYEMTADAATGDHAYTFTLKDNLRFSDGSPITAQDFVFSVLLLSAPELKENGAPITTYSSLRGWKAFSEGTCRVFSGVRLLSDLSFSVTISAESLPYFYEMTLVYITPYPISVLAPQCGVADDGNGAYLTGDFTVELLKKTLFDEKTGYVSHPSVVSGAYCLTDYDAATGVAKFDLNPYFPGNYDGQKPTIKHLVMKEVKNETLLSELENGTVDLVNKVSSGAVIDDGLKMAAQGKLASIDYPRAGLSFLAFSCESRLGSSEKLRKATALSIDDKKLCDDYLKGYGLPVYGYYGIGQWMAAEQLDALTALDLYELDLGAARDLIIRDGWVYNDKGEIFATGKDQVRYRALDADGVPVLSEEISVAADKGAKFDTDRKIASFEPLTFKMAIPADNQAADLLVGMMQTSFAQLGVGLEVTALRMDELLRHYYRQTERTYDMFFLASNFYHVFDPYYTYHTDEAYQGIFNRSGLKDEKLMRLAEELRQVPAGDKEEYKAKWLEFQTYWTEVLPMVPLCSNVYYDLYTPRLINYSIDAFSSWVYAIVYASFAE